MQQTVTQNIANTLKRNEDEVHSATAANLYPFFLCIKALFLQKSLYICYLLYQRGV